MCGEEISMRVWFIHNMQSELGGGISNETLLNIWNFQETEIRNRKRGNTPTRSHLEAWMNHLSIVVEENFEDCKIKKENWKL